MELTGTLDRFPLRELLEMMQFSSMCGVLELEASNGLGAIYAKDGIVYHAEYAGETGNLALWLLFEELEAAFHVRDGVAVEQQTLSSDLSYLMAEGERQAQRWKALRPRIPHLRIVPVLTHNAPTGVQLDEIDWPVMAAIDGQRTIREIANHAFIDTLDTCKILLRLTDAGLVTLSTPGAPLSVEQVQPIKADMPPSGQAAPPERPAVKAPAPLPPISPLQRGGLFKRPGVGVEAPAPSPPPDLPPPKSLIGRLRESLPANSPTPSSPAGDDDRPARTLRGR